MTTKLTEVKARDLADTDLLINEGRIAQEIWHQLAMPCCGLCVTKCSVVCPYPCHMAARCIEKFIPRYFVNYVRWN